jgi:uncharacterized protein with PIN domain
MFSRQGAPQAISIINYNKDKETAILCPDCNTILGYRSNDNMFKIGSSVVIGVEKIVCHKCNKDINVK